MGTKNKERDYEVECVITYNGIVTIKAASETEALQKADMMMNPKTLESMPDNIKVGDIDFTFGEGSAYNAYLLKNNE